MNGRHPDFTTSRLFIQATDMQDGCDWVLQERRSRRTVATIHFRERELTYRADDVFDMDGYLNEALTVITAYLARTLLLPSVTGRGGEAVVWEKSGFKRTDDGFSLALTH
ncbi:hypothetical protein [Exiguobacterium sp. s193]|uniref:hypothetical protein n=1 Tax=Exiguobacterium sp. s193 TaxID=2751207 RepID=UPI001BE9ED4F|nr:hypothetical protein [Exiguobacterium sp. s193]